VVWTSTSFFSLICTAQFLHFLVIKKAYSVFAIKISGLHDQNMQVTCSKYWLKCDGEYSLCIFNHAVEFPRIVYSTVNPLPCRLHTSPIHTPTPFSTSFLYLSLLLTSLQSTLLPFTIASSCYYCLNFIHPTKLLNRLFSTSLKSVNK